MVMFEDPVFETVTVWVAALPVGVLPKATLEALTLGAHDYVAKASNEGSLDRSMTRLREELIPKIKQFFLVPKQPSATSLPCTL